MVKQPEIHRSIIRCWSVLLLLMSWYFTHQVTTSHNADSMSIVPRIFHRNDCFLSDINCSGSKFHFKEKLPRYFTVDSTNNPDTYKFYIFHYKWIPISSECLFTPILLCWLGHWNVKQCYASDVTIVQQINSLWEQILNFQGQPMTKIQSTRWRFHFSGCMKEWALWT